MEHTYAFHAHGRIFAQELEEAKEMLIRHCTLQISYFENIDLIETGFHFISGHSLDHYL